jgi:threonine dehydratase
MELTCAVGVDDVFAAHDRLRRILPPTPVVYSESRGAFLKLDNLQATGAFKVRGALNALAAQVERGDRRPVIAASAGNHALGVAWAGRHFGLRVCVVVPTAAPQTKIAGCRRLGAEVVLRGHCFEEALEYAGSLADGRGWRFLHAFDDPDVIAGQGTLAVELLPLRPDVVLVPIGGGGLAAGAGLVLQASDVRVIGVQVEGADAMARRLRGEPAHPSPAVTIADGLRVHQPGRVTSELCDDLVDDILVVSDAEVRRTVVDLFADDGIIAEGAAAAAVAALPRVVGSRKVAVISGGNIDGQLLAELLRQYSPEGR